MQVIEKHELGFRIANPNAVGSFATLEHRDAIGTDPQLDTITVDGSGNFTQFTFNGTAVPVSPAIPVNQPEAIQAAIEDYISSNRLEGNVWVRVTYEGTDLTVEHAGYWRLNSISVSDVGGGSPQATTQLPNLKTVCNLRAKDNAAVVDNLGDVTHAGNSATLANNPYAFSGTPATDAATAAQLATDLDTALAAVGLTLYAGTEVTVNTNTSSYDIKAQVQQGSSKVVLQGVMVTLAEQYCRAEFVA